VGYSVEPLKWEFCIYYKDVVSKKYIEKYDKYPLVEPPYYMFIMKMREDCVMFYENKNKTDEMETDENKNLYLFIKNPIKKSKCVFSVIQYKNRDDIIDIEIPPNYYYVGNCLLSSLFLSRYLKYHFPTIVFNENYNLVITEFDSNFNITNFTLNSKQSIILKEDSYTIQHS
jgi:hypothetical protein